MASLTITPESGEITAAETACRIDVTEADQNDDTAYDVDEYPASPAIVYRIRARLSGQDDLLSHPFTPSAEGEHQWYAPLFPAAGGWTVTLRDTSDDSEVATLAVTVN
jgi:hypothetical protein